MRTIGVVTSASGAVIHDIAKVAFRRGAVRILIAPTLVQGAGAGERIIAALDLIERALEIDVVIIARGGGSSDDLMAFNEERVVRRVAACRIPIVSAIGHEVDVTLADLAADLRAATPSQAAELVVADRSARIAALAQTAVRLRRAMAARLVEDRAVTERLAHGLSKMRVRVAEQQQQVDDRHARMKDAILRAIRRKRAEGERLFRQLSGQHPRAIVANARVRLGPLQLRLESGERELLARSRGNLAERCAQLTALSPLAVLCRGYSITTRGDGKAVRSADDVAVGDRVRVRLDAGGLFARVEGLYTLPDAGLRT